MHFSAMGWVICTLSVVERHFPDIRIYANETTPQLVAQVVTRSCCCAAELQCVFSNHQLGAKFVRRSWLRFQRFGPVFGLGSGRFR